MSPESVETSDLQQLVAGLPFALYVCEAPGGTIRFFNRRAADLWGREPILGDPDERFCGSLRLFRPDGSACPRDTTPMAETIRTGEPRQAELIVERPDGSRVVVGVSTTPLRDAAGRLSGAVNVFQDITSRKSADEALRMSEARYRAMVEDQPDLVCRFLPDGTITFANEAYCRYFGVSREAIAGTRYNPIVHPEDLPRVQALVSSLTPARPVVIIENRVLRHDGAVRWAQWTNRALYDDRGHLVELQSAGRDITERKQAEKDLRTHFRALEGLYRLTETLVRVQRVPEVCEAAADAVVTIAGAPRASVLVFDEEGVMRFQASRGLSGAYRAAVDGHSPWTPETKDAPPILVEDVLTDSGLAPFREVIAAEGIRALAFIPLTYQRRLLGKLMLYHEMPHRFTEEELRLAATIAHHVAFGIVRARAETAIVAALSRERVARRDADLARADAERAMRAKDEFLAMLAHELRNPLSVIVNAIAVLGHAQDASASERARATIQRQTQHLARLLDDLLDVARITSGRIELERRPVDLGAALALAAESQRFALESRRQRLNLPAPDTVIAVVGDAVRLQQVFGNLLNNASKYSPPDTAIHLSTAVEAGEAVFRIRDEGAGISADKLEWIFELFAQADPTLARTEGGLGIGLTLVRRIVELHGGSIHASSEGPGRGAEFVVRLPLAQSAVQPAPEPEPTPAARVIPRRILVIEDHDDGREMVALTLQMHGHEVIEASTGRSGIELATRHVPDAVLVDIGLPDIQGYEVARELRRALGGRVRLIALTGYGQPADRARSQEAGFDAHLVKPVDPAVLSGELERLS